MRCMRLPIGPPKRRLWCIGLCRAKRWCTYYVLWSNSFSAPPQQISCVAEDVADTFQRTVLSIAARGSCYLMLHSTAWACGMPCWESRALDSRVKPLIFVRGTMAAWQARRCFVEKPTTTETCRLRACKTIVRTENRGVWEIEQASSLFWRSPVALLCLGSRYHVLCT